MKVAPLPDPVMEGSPYLGTSSLIFLITMDVVSFVMGKASTHPENVFTKTRWLNPSFSFVLRGPLLLRVSNLAREALSHAVIHQLVYAENFKF